MINSDNFRRSRNKEWKKQKSGNILMGFLYIDIAGSSKQKYPEHTRKKIRDFLFNKTASIAERRGGRQHPNLQGDGVLFMFLLANDIMYNHFIAFAIELLNFRINYINNILMKEIPGFKEPIKIRISGDIDTGCYDTDLGKITSKGLDRLVKHEREIGIENYIVITDRIYSQIDSDLKSQFNEIGRSDTFSSEIYKSKNDITIPNRLRFRIDKVNKDFSRRKENVEEDKMSYNYYNRFRFFVNVGFGVVLLIFSFIAAYSFMQFQRERADNFMQFQRERFAIDLVQMWSGLYKSDSENVKKHYFSLICSNKEATILEVEACCIVWADENKPIDLQSGDTCHNKDCTDARKKDKGEVGRLRFNLQTTIDLRRDFIAIFNYFELIAIAYNKGTADKAIVDKMMTPLMKNWDRKFKPLLVAFKKKNNDDDPWPILTAFHDEHDT